ncbi:MerR family DNA-binding transcriptional regulator [Occultella gossypii]|uniref:MerR family DNA-binding transcriptional regulator n=1 Tax=Occultella gossypii TaxID=2800820 RepID=A0ABS7S373_9MICO|nr:MerR family DNA-binding transcriptional regulator [Occultella gossypii]MBZ2194790.1 MerR family DNA-binding transcriptional regulator [Occultella gossypii]
MLIGEVSELSGISARMLRHYDSIGLVRPTGRTAGGYRQYSEGDVRRLFHVEGLRALGLTLAEIGDALEDLSFSPESMVEHLLERTRERLAREQELLGRLGQVRASEPADWSDVLRTIGLMRALDAGSSARHRVALSMPDGGRSRDAVVLAEAMLSEAEPNAAGALQWALARTGDAALGVLAQALASPDAERRHRAAAALTKFDSSGADAILAGALRHEDPIVRARAALARGSRGDLDAVPGLVAMVVDASGDVDAAGALGALAERHDRGDEIARALADALPGASAAARQRLTTALADVPGAVARASLEALVDDPDGPVSLTATAVLRAREPR